MLGWLTGRGKGSPDLPIIVELAAKDAAYLPEEEDEKDLVMIVAGAPLRLRVSFRLEDEDAVVEWAGRDVLVTASRSGRKPKETVTLPYTLEDRSIARLELNAFPAGRHELEVEAVTARDGISFFRRSVLVQVD